MSGIYVQHTTEHGLWYCIAVQKTIWGRMLVMSYTHTSRIFISCGSSRFLFFGGARFSSFLQWI